MAQRDSWPRAQAEGAQPSGWAALGRLGRWLRRCGLALGRRLGAPRPVATRLARNGSVAVAYDVRGHGPPLVLLQGLGVGRWGWEPVADRLARRFQVITIDNRGIGASDAPPGPYSTRAMAGDVLAVLDDAGKHTPLLADERRDRDPGQAALACRPGRRRWRCWPSSIGCCGAGHRAPGAGGGCARLVSRPRSGR